jgi:dihydroxyacetone kinase-like predicted kinase
MDGNKYSLEFILVAQSVSEREIADSLVDISDKAEVSVCAEGEFKVCVLAEDPTLVFDVCAQFGRIKSAKIDEVS